MPRQPAQLGLVDRTARACRSFALALSAVAPVATLVGQHVRQAPPAVLAPFDVGAGTLQSIPLPPRQQDHVVATVRLGGTWYTLDVTLHDVRSPNFQLLERTSTGLIPHPRPACVTYRGALRELPGARVAATVVGGSMEAMIYLPPRAPGQPHQTWVVQPVRQVQPAAGASLHLVYREVDSLSLPHQCGTPPGPPASTPAGAADFTAVCEIAIEADEQFWQWNNASVTQTQNDITSVMNQADFIYDRDVDVNFTVVTIVVSTTPVYTTNNANSLLGQFTSNWNANYGSVQRDVAHLFTGRNLSGSTIGIAYQSVVCSSTNAYGLSQSDFSNNFNRRVGLTCHELGHNFSSGHCNGNNPCYIMCASLNGCSNSVTQFGPSAAAQIDSYAHSLSCMPPPAAPPVLTGLNPSTAPVFAPGGLTLTGSGLATVDRFTVSGQTYTSGILLQGDSQVSVSLPEGSAFGPTSVTVGNPLGTSNPVTFTYTVTQPPRLRSTGVIPPVGGLASFGFASVPGNQWFLLLGVSPLTAPFQGLDILSNPLLMAAGTYTSPVGIAGLGVPVPPGLSGLQFFFQVVEGNPAGVAAGVSNITTTILQ